MEIPSNPLPPDFKRESDAEMAGSEVAWAVGEMAGLATLGWFIIGGPVGALLGGIAGSFLYKATRTS